MKFLEALTTTPPPPGWTLVKATSDRAAIDLGSPPVAIGDLLAPDTADVADALAAIPNGPDDGVDYDAWISILHAVAGSTGKSAQGRDLWLEWSAQYDPEPAAAEARWQSLDAGALSIGWSWLRERAAAASASFRHASAAEDFAGPHLNGVKVMDGGLFEKPATDASDIQAMVENVDPKDAAAIHGVTKAMARSSLTDIARDFILRRLKDRTGLTLKTLERQLANDMRNLRRDEDDVQLRLAIAALDDLGADRLAFYRGGWWTYTGKYWQRQQGDTFIHAAILRLVRADPKLLMAGSGQQHHSASMIMAAIKNLAALCSRTLAVLDDNTFTVRAAINCRNGTLWISRDGDIELRKHDPRDCFFSMVDIEYDPLATGTLYDRTLADMQSLTAFTLTKESEGGDWAVIKETVDRNNTSEENPLTLPDGRRAWRDGNSYRMVDVADNCRMINEILGYAMISQRFARAFVIFRGNGVNGKSELVRLISARMGSQAYATTIDTLASRFIVGQLQGVTLLTIDEGADSETPSSRIKELTEGTPLRADVKGKDFVDVTLTSLPIVNTNSHFASKDASDGIRSRILIVPFRKKYNEADRVNNPWPKIGADENEISAAFNRWVDGVADVVRRRYILRTKASDQARQLWETRNTSEAAFIAEWCLTKQPRGEKSDGEKLGDLHRAFLGWNSVYNGGNKFAHGQRRFSETLQSMNYTPYLSQGVTRFRGLWLNPAKTEMPGFAGSDFEPIEPEARATD